MSTKQKIPCKLSKKVVKQPILDNDSENTPLDSIDFPKKRIIMNTNNSNNNNTPLDSIDFPKKRIIFDKCDDSKKVDHTRENVSLVNMNTQLFKNNSEKSTFIMIKNAWNTLTNYKIPINYKIILSHPGHFITLGHYSGALKNAHWLVRDENTKEEYYIMHCNGDYYTKFSKEDYKDVINPSENHYPTWHYEKNGYILTKSYNLDRGHMYLHQLICQKHQEKKFITQSVDHINREKIDNRLTNLRFATQSQQNQNTEKRERKYNAQDLPDGIGQKEMPKYVGYKSEKYGPDKKHFRNGFIIEKHPYQNILCKLKTAGQKIDDEFPIRWNTTKSMQIKLRDKLELVIKKRKEYDEEFKNKYPKEYKEWIKISQN